jgi:hypothetical protein
LKLWIPDREDEVTAAHVLGALNLQAPGLEAVRAAMEQGNERQAGRALVRHFYERKDVRFLFDYRGQPLQKIDPNDSPYSWQSSLGLSGDLQEFMLYVGRKMMENVYVLPGKGRGEHALGARFETMPHFRFPEDLARSHRHTLDMFVRGQFFESLAVLYHEDGDPRVAEKFREVLQVFFKTYPLNVEHGGPDTGRFMTSEDRDVMSAGWLTIVLLSLFYTELPYTLPEDETFDLLRHIWFYAMQFRRFDGDRFRSHNHHMFERGLVPFILSLLLPEFPEIAAMREHGREVVSRHVHEDFGSHGQYSEHSIAYWSGAAIGEMLSRGMSLGNLNGVPMLDEEGTRNVDRSLFALAMASAPGERFPTLGDNRGPMIDPILSLGVRMTGNETCKQLLRLRQGEEGTGPEVLDFCDNVTGFVTSRNRWGADGNFFLMSLKENCGYSGHNHMDMLSLFIHLRGEELIGEPYTGKLYHTVRHASEHRGFMYNMSSHNTVLAYGEPIQPDRCYANKWGVLRPDVKLEEQEIAPDYLYLRARHDAYTHCSHQRAVLFVREKGWWIRDALLRGNRQEADHRQRWFFTPGTALTQLSSHALLVEGSRSRMLMAWQESPRFSLELWRPDFLCPEIFPSVDALGMALDVHFGIHPKSDSLIVPLQLLLLDVTGRELPEEAELSALFKEAPDLSHAQLSAQITAL